jgi:hypothetical protein
VQQEPVEPPSRPNPQKAYSVPKILVINIAILAAVAVTAYFVAEDVASLRTYLFVTGGLLFMIGSGFVIAGIKDPMSAPTGAGGGYVPSLRPDEIKNVSKMMSENMRNSLRIALCIFPAMGIVFLVALLL